MRGTGEKSDLDELGEAISSINERESRYQREREALISAVGNRLKGVVDSVESFKQGVRSFNKSLKDYRVSNLQSIEFIVDNNNAAYLGIERLVAHSNDSDLFSDPDRALAETEALMKRIEDGVDLTIDRLTKLGVRIKKRNGDIVETFKSDQLESNGTSLTVRVIVNVMLLRKFMATGRSGAISIPFYIDESASLDDANRKTLVDLCRRHNFVPVFAAPTPQTGATYFIMVETINGLAFVNRKRHWRRIETAEPNVELAESG